MEGLFIVILGPTGSGKSTLQNMLIEKYPKLKFAISCTTREIRDYEVEGVNYYFLTNNEFEEKLNKGDLLEHAFVHFKFYYGLLKSTVIDSLENGEFLIKDIEFKGLFQLKKVLPENNFKSIFILPPLREEIIKRLHERAYIRDDELNKRLKSMDEELNLKDNCDIIFEPISGDIDGTFEKFEEVFFELTRIDRNQLS